MPTGQAHMPYSLAALCAAGGLMGYLKKGSTPSLVGGLAIGACYVGAGYLIEHVDAYQGHLAGVACSVLLTAVMGARLAKTRKVMPAGLLTGLGAVATVYHAKKAQEWS